MATEVSGYKSHIYYDLESGIHIRPIINFRVNVV